METLTFLLVRATLPALSPQSTLCRFSGGIHAFLAMAAALAAHDRVSLAATANDGDAADADAGGDDERAVAVAVLSCCPRNALLRDAAEQGYLFRPGGSPTPSPWTPGVVRVEVGGVRHHVALTDAPVRDGNTAAAAAAAAALVEQWRRRCEQDGSSSSSSSSSKLSATAAAEVVARLPPAQAAMMLEALALACRAPPGRVVVILNADGAQGPLGRQAGATATPTHTPTPTLTEAVAAVFGARAHALVQNVHGLPFGPYGGAARGSDALQAAWGRFSGGGGGGGGEGGGGGGGNGGEGGLPALGGAIAVSRFVRLYLMEHAPGLPRVLHVPLSAWGVFGQGPWRDYGGELAAAAAAADSAGGQEGPAPPPFVVACPKLTSEKGLGLMEQLARRLPDVRFVGVAADAGVGADAGGPTDEAAAAAGAAGGGDTSGAPPLQPRPPPPPNLRLLPPSLSLEPVLRGAALCLCPSLWREAYGMAAVDAALRGVPVAASAGCGGLTEAALLLMPPSPPPPRPGDPGGEDEEETQQEDAAAADTWPARLLPVEFVSVPSGDDAADDAGGAGGRPPPPSSPPWSRRVVPSRQPDAVTEAWAAAVLEAREELLASPSAFARRSAATRARALAMVGEGEKERRAFVGRFWRVDGGALASDVRRRRPN